MRRYVITCAAVVLVGAAVVSGRAQRQPASLDDVVSELRALRTDLQRTGGTTARMQLLTARLSAQEQRIGILSSQRANITPRLIEATRARAELESQVKRFEDMSTKHIPSEVPPAELEGTLEHFRNTLAHLRDAERQLRTQDDQLAAEIANEQTRWLDFNGRLDALERELK